MNISAILLLSLCVGNLAESPLGRIAISPKHRVHCDHLVWCYIRATVNMNH
jgi:hypothetical protein